MEQEQTGYDASRVESKWYARWQSAGLFEPGQDDGRPTYSVTIPPPNITGSLHMGHALCYSLQDMLGRYRRMQGDRVLILPGQDHAGIATQSVVDKQLRAQGSSASQIGREAFTERVWEWRHESGNTILSQLQSLGCAFDWSRLRFTLDDKYHNAVLKVFIEWFDRGLIYRGRRVVNWDPALKTSVSDIETERKLIKGKLYHVRYPFTDGSGSVTIATTRPETMLADVAVAVHPDDPRYQGQVGQTLTLPLVGRQIPLIADEYPDPEFGTGAVKITPGHDANDFEVGQRHNLEILVTLDQSAKIDAPETPYHGLSREAARKQIVEDLESQGFLEKVDDHEIAILISDRSKDVIEPMASDQWFVDQRALAKEAIQVVESGKIKFYPERVTGVYLDWLENIRDWCISRQLWWGHRIPVYYTASGDAFAATSWEEAQQQAGAELIVRQDDDVLDTWFSSGLWPFATLGWPGQTDDLKQFYPTNVLVTARDILYLWVARMVMMGMDFVGEIPFHHVYIYATVLTEDGKRMSKSLGTGVDPMDIITEKGADALRYTLLSQTGSNQDIRYSDRRTVDARNFCNKIWNASKFVMMNLEGFDGQEPDHLEGIDRWLLSRLAACEQTVREGIEAYDVQKAANALHTFFWSEMCDWYIEISKERLQSSDQRRAPQWVLHTALKGFLKLAHPVMPFITEEVYNLLPVTKKADFLMSESWPAYPTEWSDAGLEATVESWFEMTRGLRALRAELGQTPIKKLPEAFYEGDLKGGEEVVRSQAWFTQLVPGRPDGKFVSVTVAGADFHLPITGLVDEAAECDRLSKQLEKAQKELVSLERRLSNPSFVQNAKPDVVERDQAAAAALREKVEKIQARLQLFGC